MQERVLLVDDEAAIARGVATLLTKQGFDVVVALCGGDAIARQADSSAPFDVAVIDLTMPDMSGVELAHALRGTQPDLMVIFTTGQPDDVSQAATTGVTHQGILAKPFRARELVARLRAQLG